MCGRYNVRPLQCAAATMCGSYNVRPLQCVAATMCDDDDGGDGGGDGGDGRISGWVQAPSPSHPGIKYPVRANPSLR